MNEREFTKNARVTVRVITNDIYLFQKLRLEFPEWITISESEGDICLADIDSAEAPEGAYTMSRRGACDFPIPSRLGSALNFVEEKLSGGALISTDEKRKCAYLYGKEIKLTELEVKLLSELILGGGEFIPRARLIEKVFDGANDSGMLNLYIHYLREKLEKSGEKIIISSRKAGYKIDERFLKTQKGDKKDAENN